MSSLTRSALFSYVVCCAFFAVSRAHMSIFAPSMYGIYRNPPGTGDLTGETINWPMANRYFKDYWMHGPAFTSVPPFGPPTELPAGGLATFTITCGAQFGPFWQQAGFPASQEAINGSQWDACPHSPGNYHSDPAGQIDIPYYHHGCALAIADVDDISLATPSNMAVFSTLQNCVGQKVTSFEVPAKMPPCTGSKCICAFFWTQAEGPFNWYMTGFDCTVTGSPPDATPIAPPQPPAWCDPNFAGQGASSSCVSGSKQAILGLYQLDPSNLVNQPNINLQHSGWYYRPGYTANFSFPNNGAQNDIFELPAPSTATSTSTSAPTTTTTMRFGLQPRPATVTTTKRLGLQPPAVHTGLVEAQGKWSGLTPRIGRRRLH